MRRGRRRLINAVLLLVALYYGCSVLRVAGPAGLSAGVGGGVPAFLRAVHAAYIGETGMFARYTGLPSLVTYLGDADAGVRSSAVAALGRLGTDAAPAVPLIADLLVVGPPAARASAALALGEVVGPETARTGEDVVPILAASLASADFPVRAAAARALGRVGRWAAPAARQLVRCLGDPEADVRRAAAEALGRIADSRRISSLGKRATEEVWWAGAVDALVALLRDPDGMAAVAAARALGQIGELAANAVPALAEPLYVPGSAAGLRMAAAGALGSIGGPAAKEAVPMLANALRGDPDAGVRACAADALLALGPYAKDGVPALKAALYDANPVVRRFSARALGRLGPLAAPAVLKLLDVATSDDDEKTRVVATNALKALSRKTADGLEIAGIAVSGRRAAEFRTSTDGAITFPREVLNERIQRLNDAAE